MGERIRQGLVWAVLVGTSGGCASLEPPDNVDFGRIDSLHALTGTYRNLGESAVGATPTYLSEILWPAYGLVDHAAVDRVEVTAIDEGALRVRARGGDAVRREAVFRRGEDFELREGRLSLNRGLRMLGTEAGEPILGAGSETVELGLDQRGDGKYASRGAGAGMVFLVLPMAYSVSQEVRFVRLDR